MGEEDVVIPLRIVTKNAMTVFDLMSNGEQSSAEEPDLDLKCSSSIKEKLKKYSDDHLKFGQIASQEIEVTVYFADKETKIGEVDTKMKLKRPCAINIYQENLLIEMIILKTKNTFFTLMKKMHTYLIVPTVIRTSSNK